MQRDESGGVGSSHTRTSVTARLVSDGELCKVVSDHFRLDFNKVEVLSVVHTKNGSNHFRDDNHVPEMGLHRLGLLADRGCLLCLTQLLDQGEWLALKTTGETTTLAGVDFFHKFLMAQFKELLEFNTTVGKLAERTLFTQSSEFLRCVFRLYEVGRARVSEMSAVEYA
jgi:hypothetical protein